MMAAAAKDPSMAINKSMMARVEAALAATNAPAASTQKLGTGASGSKGKDPHNAICVKATIIDFVVAKTTPAPPMPAKDYTTYTLLVTDTGTGAIDSRYGYRNVEGYPCLKIWTEQPMNDIQKAEYALTMDKRNVKAGDTRRNLKKVKKFIAETAELSPGIYRNVKIFSGPRTDSKGLVFGQGAEVIISGIEPTLTLAMTADGAKGSSDFGVQWNIGKFYADSKASPGNLKGTWDKQKVGNTVPNLYNGPGGGYSPTNVTAEEKAMIELWEKEGTQEKNGWRIVQFNLAPAERVRARGTLYIPLGQDARFSSVSPFEMGQRYAVKFKNITFGEVFADFPKDALPTMEVTVLVETEILRINQPSEKAFIKVYINSKNAGELAFNRFGIVNPFRWSKVAPAYMPWVSGYLVTRLNLNESLKLTEFNESLLNSRDEQGNPQTGFHYGAQYNATYIDPDLASMVLSPNAFQISLECVILLNRVALGNENPSNTTSEYAKTSPLLSGTRPVINEFECNEDPKVLQEKGYSFWLVYAMAKQSERAVALKIRKYITANKLDPVKEFSKIFMTPPKVDEPKEGEDHIYDNMPVPDFEKTDSYCVFAIKNTEVDRVLKGPPELPMDEFLAEVARIQAAELVKYGPLPPVPDEPARPAAPPAAVVPAQPAVVETTPEVVKPKPRLPATEEVVTPPPKRVPMPKKPKKAVAPPPEDPSMDLDEPDVDAVQ